MTKVLPMLLLFFSCSQIKTDKGALLQETDIRLSTPQISLDSVLFLESAKLSLEFDLEESFIYYAIGQGPFVKYSEPLLIRQSCLVRAFAKKKGFLNSDIIESSLIKIPSRPPITKCSTSPEAHENYPGKGAESLTDLQLGSLNFRADNFWLGYQSDTVLVDMELEEAMTLNKMYLSMLLDFNSWIFLPQRLEVWHDTRLVGALDLASPDKNAAARLNFVPVDIQAGKYSNLQLRIIQLKEIPAWHPGSGTTPWLFIDEILVE